MVNATVEPRLRSRCGVVDEIPLVFGNRTCNELMSVH